jgi:dTDP-4-amino-4,6-dideoxy-D-galactose acyltransferase
LYGAWIEKSCRGYAQAVLVAERDAKPAGYVTCHWQGTTGQIGLIAVAEWARGVGIGGNLVDAAVHTFEKAGASHTTVVTQGRNLASQRLYQKRGFITKSVELWYHLWFPSAE